MVKTEKGYGQIFKIFGRSETEVKERLKELLKQGGAAVVYTRRRQGEVHVIAEVSETDEDAAKVLLKPVAKELKRILGDWYYSTKESETMEAAVVKLLKKYGLTVTTAESCTGGMIAAKLVNVSGASEVFEQGFITYSNKAKRKLLGVGKNTLKKYGAVSSQTAGEMAAGVVEAAEADAGLSVTGIAGPDGGSDEKPVGLVYIGCMVRGTLSVEEHRFHGTRAEIREQSALSALDLLRREIIRECH